MAEAVATPGMTQAACSTCGHEVPIHERIPATFCMECGCCVLSLADGSPLPPLVLPTVLEEGAWKAFTLVAADGDRAVLRNARLLFVPWHEWAPDLGRRRLIRDARAVVSPAADLLASGLRPTTSPLGDDVRGLAVAAAAHQGRLADPRTALELIRRGEIVDITVPPTRPAPPGAGGGTLPRPLYYPFWFLTYAVDHKERVGVIDAANGRAIGPSQPPNRWTPAIRAAITGGVAFAAAWIAGGLALPAPLAAAGAGAISLGAAWLALGSAMIRERGR